MRTSFVGVPLLIVVASSFSTAQQESRCPWRMRGGIGAQVRLPEGGARYDASGGVEATCGPKWLRADSVSWYEQRGVAYLFGGVQYRDQGRVMSAQQATYYMNEDRVRAVGNVEVTDSVGRSKLTAPLMDYYPANASRPGDRLVAHDRPHLIFYPDSSAAAEPFDVDADRMYIFGDSAITGSGRVVAVRGDLHAYGDSIDLDLGSGELWLLGEAPRLEAGQTTLLGDTILILMVDNQVREIQAWVGASASGDNMELSAPLLRLFIEADEIGRVVATPGDPARTGAVDADGREPWARSVSRDYTLTADSIEIRRPGGRLEQVVAVGRAHAETVRPAVPGDTLLGTDWLDGDTITGYFASLPAAPDSVNGEPELERLVSSGEASALYHLRDEARGTEGTDATGLNYVKGKQITLFLELGEVELAQVIGPARGVYLEPLPQGPPPDTTGVAADSIGDARIDTVSARTHAPAPPARRATRAGPGRSR